MALNDRVTQRLEQLISQGEDVLATQRSPGRNVIGDNRVDQQLGHQWATSVQSLLCRVFGSESEHYRNFTKQVQKFLTYSPARRALGVLLAAKDDYENGYLFDIRRLVEAEVFDDFLGQAEHLLSAGYFAPAAVVAGAVLEDGLRKLCTRHEIPLRAAPKLDGMNAELARVGAYSVLVQKRVTALADLRHRAAHGRWDEFSSSDVDDMIALVRRFMEEHFE